jgi:PadR family transcriptional regulator PadR
MAPEAKLSYTAAVILKAIGSGHRYGFEVMDAIGLPSGTVYPALRRLEALGVVTPVWESEEIAQKQQRPPRKYYSLTAGGRELLASAEQRYRLPEFASAARR